MSDNVAITAGSGTTIAADDIAGVMHQRVKISIGADGAATDWSSAAPAPVAAAGDVAHDAADNGNPVKVGGRAINALPTAVANGDRVNLVADLFGRLLTASIDPAQQVWKRAAYTSAQTGTTIWDPTSGKRIAITSIVLGSYGTTQGDVQLWFGANGDTTYSAGTDQPVYEVTMTPTATATPGVVFTPPTPVFCTTADHELHITTSAALSLRVVVYGYEW